MSENIELVRVRTESSKGQASQTVSQRDQESESTSTRTTSAKQDTQTTKAASVMQITFTMRFRNESPVTPDGETEPNPSAC